MTPEQEKVLEAWAAHYPYPIMGLIEAMRSVQKWHLCIKPEDEEYLAGLFKTTRTRVHEVANFFPFFTQEPTGRFRVGICRGLSCALAGSAEMTGCLREKLGVEEGRQTPDKRFSFEAMECLGACDFAPALLVNEELKGRATEPVLAQLAADPEAFMRRPAPRAFTAGYAKIQGLTRDFSEPDLHQLETYRRRGGYSGLEKALGLKPEALIEEVKKSNLRGLGGAGFPTGMKWATVPPREQVSGPRYVVANADESEPGCFKDRVLIERTPHQLIEGLLIAAYAIGAEEAFVFIRGEYANQYKILESALREAEAAGFVGRRVFGKDFSCRVMIMRGAGAYISGLDTALLETMEGKRAWPRQPPPFPTNVGLMGKPTVVNNVETLSMLPMLLRHGGESFAKLGVAKSGGTAAFSVSGHVEKPGVYEFPMGTPLRRIIEAAGGVRAGRGLKAVIPGGASTPVLSASEIDVAMDFDGLRAAGSFLGAGGIIVLDDSVNMASAAHNIERFLAHESCGQCTPCREGSEWTVRILERTLQGRGDGGDIANLERIGENITGKVICALGDTVGMVTRAFIKKFPADFEAKKGASA